MTHPALGFGLGLVLTPLLIRVLRGPALQCGFGDKPCARKQHEGVVPVIGGLAMFLVLMLATWIGQPDHFLRYDSLFGALGLMVLIGAIDDRWGLSARLRLVIQAGTALLLVYGGEPVISNLGDLLGFGELHLSFWALPFTVFAVIGMINAINMSDGLDGLAGGLALIALTWFMAVALALGAYRASLILFFMAVLLGFLACNLRHRWRRKAGVFMGDAGSMMLGLVLAWLAISLSQRPGAQLSPIVAVWILGLPLLDTVSVMVRRVAKGRSPFSPDREHLHHILLLAGYSDAQVVSRLHLAALLLGGIGVGAWWAGVPDYVLFYAFMVLFAAYYYTMLHAWRVMRLLKRHVQAPAKAATPELAEEGARD